MIVDKCEKTCFMARPTEQVVVGGIGYGIAAFYCT